MAAICLLAAPSCKKEAGITGLSFEEGTSLAMLAGESRVVTCIMQPEQPAGTATVSWSSSNPDIVSVSGSGENGYLTASARGSAVISATCGRRTASINVTVVGSRVNAFSIINLDEGFSSRLTLYASETKALSVFVTDPAEGADAECLAWSASEPGIIEITAHGSAVDVKGLAPGEVTLTGTGVSTDGKQISRDFPVTVENPWRLKAVKGTGNLTTVQPVIAVGGSVEVALTSALECDFKEVQVNWSNSDPEVASMQHWTGGAANYNSSMIKGLKGGKTTIRAYNSEFSAELEINVLGNSYSFGLLTPPWGSSCVVVKNGETVSVLDVLYNDEYDCQFVPCLLDGTRFPDSMAKEFKYSTPEWNGTDTKYWQFKTSGEYLKLTQTAGAYTECTVGVTAPSGDHISVKFKVSLSKIALCPGEDVNVWFGNPRDEGTLIDRYQGAATEFKIPAGKGMPYTVCLLAQECHGWYPFKKYVKTMTSSNESVARVSTARNFSYQYDYMYLYVTGNAGTAKIDLGDYAFKITVQ